MINPIQHLAWMLLFLLAALVLTGIEAERESTTWTSICVLIVLSIAIDIGYTIHVMIA